MSDIAIKVENVSKEYRLGAIGGTTLREEMHRFADRLFHRTSDNPDYGKEFMALQNINLEVKKGERLGIIGHNGAGKSTLLKLLARVTGPTTGTISYNGRISSMLEVGTGFHGELTGRENIYMNGAILGMTKKEIDHKINDIIAFAEMEKFIDTPVKRYSSGMYVKLAFAVAAHLDNEILIMDEVLAVGDMKFQQKCLGKMGDSSRTEGKTVLYVSHNMGTIRQLCQRCIVLDHGKIIFDGDVEKAISHYAERNNELLKQEITFPIPSDWENNKQISVCFHSARIEHENCIVSGELDVISLSLKINLKESLTNVYLFAILNDFYDNSLGFSTSEALSFSKNGFQDIQIKIPISGLMSGKYKMRFVIFRSVQRQAEVLARTASLVAFERLDSPFSRKLIYSKTLHGNFDMGQINVSM